MRDRYWVNVYEWHDPRGLAVEYGGPWKNRAAAVASGKAMLGYRKLNNASVRLLYRLHIRRRKAKA